MATQETKRLVVLRKADDAQVYRVEAEAEADADGMIKLSYSNGKYITEAHVSMLMKPSKAQLKNYQKEL